MTIPRNIWINPNFDLEYVVQIARQELEVLQCQKEK
jgi:hypothetical protein